MNLQTPRQSETEMSSRDVRQMHAKASKCETHNRKPQKATLSTLWSFQYNFKMLPFLLSEQQRKKERKFCFGYERSRLSDECFSQWSRNKKKTKQSDEKNENG